jgi:hypothetical protein
MRPRVLVAEETNKKGIGSDQREREGARRSMVSTLAIATTKVAMMQAMAKRVGAEVGVGVPIKIAEGAQNKVV